ncbi:hypothetical protein [uncultured Microbacterium sp.]|uniref:hypothetical protein n=1 Tax=uncultured Microbacterium sp. TaxID=191216 RepID=UPI00262910F3|nr:hypothetical protein [uncultured Microbacterium sp.]
MTTTKVATDALSDLVHTARERARTDRNRQRTKRAQAHEHIARTLDGARTRLVQDGPEYLDAAWAFVDGGRKLLANLADAKNADAPAVMRARS